MSGSVLLDTNILIALFASEPVVLARLSAAPEVFVPAVANRRALLRCCEIEPRRDEYCSDRGIRKNRSGDRLRRGNCATLWHDQERPARQGSAHSRERHLDRGRG